MKDIQSSTQTRREEKRITEIRADISLSHEAGEDITLPDYYPAIGKIVYVSARALPDAHFVTDSSIEAEGNISWSIYYIGEDGKLTFAPALTHYTMNTQLPPCAEVGGVTLDTRVESQLCRATAKRKLNLKARMRSHIIAESEGTLAESITFSDSSSVTAADLITLEKKTAEAQSMKRFVFEGTSAITAPIMLRDGSSVIGCDAFITHCGASVTEESVHIAGEAEAAIVTLSDDGRYETLSLKLPFDEKLTASGAHEGDMCRAWGRCTSISVDTGDSGATAELELELECEVCRNETAAATLDAFSTSAQIELTPRENNLARAIRCGSFNISINDTVRRKGTSASDEYIVFSQCDGRIEKCDILDGRLIISGTIPLKIIFASDSDVWGEEYSIPFKYECDGRIAASDVLWRGDVTVSNSSVKSSSDSDGGKLLIRCEAQISITAIEKTHITTVGEIKLTRESSDRHSAAVVICYPESGEELWDIAKRYRVSPRDISDLNGDSTVRVGKPLLIR